MFPLLIFLSKYYSLCMQKLVCVTIVPKLFLWESWVVQGLIVNLTMKCIQTQLNTQANAYCCIYLFLFVLHSEYFLFIYLKDFRLFFFFFFYFFSLLLQGFQGGTKWKRTHLQEQESVFLFICFCKALWIIVGRESKLCFLPR